MAISRTPEPRDSQGQLSPRLASLAYGSSSYGLGLLGLYELYGLGLYPTRDRWTRGASSRAFAHEVVLALRAGVNHQLVHESPSAVNDAESLLGGQKVGKAPLPGKAAHTSLFLQRHACEFGEFFNDDWTTYYLLLTTYY